jgi:hypothetical protein
MNDRDVVLLHWPVAECEPIGGGKFAVLRSPYASIHCKSGDTTEEAWKEALLFLQDKIKNGVNLFNLGEFTLHGGQSSDFMIDCNALTDADLEAIAQKLSQKLPPFGSVEGIPTGGLRLAKAMKKYVGDGQPLIVDDVWTTGNSMNEYRKNFPRSSVLGAVIFARGSVPPWVTVFCYVLESEGE